MSQKSKLRRLRAQHEHVTAAMSAERRMLEAHVDRLVLELEEEKTRRIEAEFRPVNPVEWRAPAASYQPTRKAIGCMALIVHEHVMTDELIRAYGPAVTARQKERMVYDLLAAALTRGLIKFVEKDRFDKGCREHVIQVGCFIGNWTEEAFHGR